MPYDPFAYVKRAQDYGREGVIGYGEALRPGLEREIGNALGGLNSIGALRSGGANVALGDITTNYAQQIGAYAKQAASEATGYGLDARRLRDEERRYQDSRRGGLFRAIGSVLGAGVGFLANRSPGSSSVSQSPGNRTQGYGGYNVPGYYGNQPGTSYYGG